MKKKFNNRAFISLVSLFLGFSVLLTGLMLYIMPYEDDVSFLSLKTVEWGFFHMVVSVYFTIIIIFHIIENWKLMISYMKSKAKENFKHKRELISAIIVSIILTIGSFTDSPIAKIINVFEPISEFFWPGYTEKHETEKLNLDYKGS